MNMNSAVFREYQSRQLNILQEFISRFEAVRNFVITVALPMFFVAIIAAQTMCPAAGPVLCNVVLLMIVMVEKYHFICLVYLCAFIPLYYFYPDWMWSISPLSIAFVVITSNPRLAKTFMCWAASGSISYLCDLVTARSNSANYQCNVPHHNQAFHPVYNWQCNVPHHNQAFQPVYNWQYVQAR